MTTVSSIKGVRTRYRNTLEKELRRAKALLYEDIGIENKETVSTDICKCITILKLYRAKIEEQMVKVMDAVGDTDTELVQRVLDEDCELILEVEKCVFDLEQFVDCLKKPITEDGEPSGATGSSDNDRVIMLQEQMQQLMANQLQHMKDVSDKQDKRESRESHSVSVKLPKIDLCYFNGNKLKWAEFWDSFECSVHQNTKLSNIEKFSYLQNKLCGEAKRAISGLALSNANYDIAIGILHKRFGNRQEIVDLHYHKLINITAPTNSVDSLRLFFDMVEKHLRSLDVLGENINQHVFVSMIRAKLPQHVLRQLEFSKGTIDEWTVSRLRDSIYKYVTDCEKAERKDNTSEMRNNQGRNQSTSNNRSNSRATYNRYNGNRFQESPRTTSTLSVNERTPSEKTSVQAYRNTCRYCEKKHWSDECPTYRSVDERKKHIKGSCFKCLKVGHSVKDCRSNRACVHCGERNHHRSLCVKKFAPKTSSVHLSEEIHTQSQSDIENEENVLVSANELVLMQTAKTEIKNVQSEKNQTVRLLLDSGSQRTYITERLAKSLCVKPKGEQEIKLITFGCEQPKTIKTKSADVAIKLNNGTYMNVTANIVPTISGTIQRTPVHQVLKGRMDHLIKSVELADDLPTTRESSTIEMLIGNDYYLDLILSEKIEIQPGLYLLGSKLGWMLTGRTQERCNDDTEANMLTLTYGSQATKTKVYTPVDKEVSSGSTLEDFWKLESIGISDDEKPKVDDEIAMKKFKETLKFVDGRYEVTWPWIDEEPDLPVNRQLAVGRLKSSVSRMKDKPELMEKYDSVIQDQLNKGVIEKTTRFTDDGPKHYIPHQAVINPTKTTTKLRVVYDASAKTKRDNKSLNDCLYRGPVILPDLCGLLMRFRTHQIAIVADIEKAFLQVGLQAKDRDTTRFVWLKDYNVPVVQHDNIQEFRFCRVPFGVVSSPFLLGATIECHLDSYDTDLARKIKPDIYVDNVISGTDTQDEAIGVYIDTKQMFTEASMNLREWMTSDTKVNKIIPTEDRAKSEQLKVLGYCWDSKSDTISIHTKDNTIHTENETYSKRTVLEQVASVFDPLGLFSPVILQGKLLLQQLWRKRYGWDDPLEPDDEQLWLEIRSDLQELSTIKIPRCSINLDTSRSELSTNTPTYKLMCYCDASAGAYAAMVYLYAVNGDKSSVNLVFSKTRLAPVKEISIPRLELLAVLIGVRCLNFVQSTIALKISDVYLWSDSQCVLKWIHSDKPLTTFVRNRVNEIKLTRDIKFGYVASKENPADIASRGTSTQMLKDNAKWWHGPHCIPMSKADSVVEKEIGEAEANSVDDELSRETQNKDFLPLPEMGETGINRERESEESAKKAFEAELRKNEVILVSGEDASAVKSPFEMDINAHSSVSKLLRVTAYASRFIKKLRKQKCENGCLTVNELEAAEEMWLSHSQQKCFSDVYSGIRNRKPTNIQTQLGIYVDNKGLLRCKGRLANADISESARYPLLLSKKDRLTHLLIEKTHKEILHSGVSQVLSHIRYKYWVPHGRATVRAVIKSCRVCRRYEGVPYAMPHMPPLPHARVSESKPFERTGIDYLGPLMVKTDSEPTKVWICLFTCLVTRAVHLEVMHNMSTEEFLLGLRRFISQRGTPTEIISDNAQHFKLASETLPKVWKNVVRDTEVQSYVSDKGIKWKFIVELAPWMGGFYERLVGLVKRSLRKAIGTKLLTNVQLQTVIKEIEAVINSRPLVYVGDDIDSSITLTPGYFLSLNPQVGIPDIEDDDNDPEYNPYESSSDKLTQIWRKGQKLLNKFWSLWRDEYLLSLRERSQNKLKSGRLKCEFLPTVGDTVLVKEDLPRGRWKMGRVISLVTSNDGLVRSAKVKTISGRVMGRPLNLLYPLETSKSDVTDVGGATCAKNNTVQNRPIREAAIKARMKIQNKVQLNTEVLIN